MLLKSLSRWLPEALREGTGGTPRKPALALEGLEAREVPAVYAVNGLADAVSANSVLTLREAVSLNTGALTFNQLTAAEKAQVSGTVGTNDQIQFTVGGTVTLGSSLPTLPKALTISGPGAGALTLHGDDLYRPFSVGANGNVTVSGLRVSHAFFATSGGAAINNGKLTLTQVEFDANTTDQHGAAVENNGTLVIDRSYFHGNTAAKVGGVIDNNATATVTNSTFADNTAGNNGGVIWSDGTLTLSNCTLFGNHAANFGGAMRLTDGTTTITSCTITGNDADTDGSGFENGGGISNDGSTLTLTNTVVAQNVQNQQTVKSDIAGAASGQFNFVGVNTDLSGITNNSGGNRVGTAGSPLGPKLLALLANGGATPTRLPAPDSPLIGTGATAALAGATDQRGVARIAGATTVGAVEGNTPPVIADVANQTNPTGAIPFTVGDGETAAGVLQVTATSSNQALVPNGNLLLGGSGANRTITVTTAAGQHGTATITLTVTDGYGVTVSDTFDVVVPPPVVSPPNPGTQLYAAGADAGGGGVRFYNPDGSLRFAADPFPGFAGGVRTAAADFNGDGVADLVVGTGPGRPTQVRILDGASQQELFRTDPFEAAFTGGVYVAAGDITGDGKPELVVTPDEGGGPRVRVFSGNGFGPIDDFLGIDDSNFRGGARPAIGDINADRVGDLIVSAGFGGGPRVAVFDGKSVGGTRAKLFGDFFAFEQALRNGVYLAAGDVNGDGFADLIAGGGPGGGPRVLVLDSAKLLQGDAAGEPLANFFAGNPDNRGGVRVAAKNLDGDAAADLVVGDGAKAGSRVTSYLGKTFSNGTAPENTAFDAFPGFNGGVFVG